MLSSGTRMKKELITSSVIILPEDDAATIVAKKNNLIQALTTGRDELPGDTLGCLRAAYKMARASGAKAEEERLMRAINRMLEMRRFLR